MLYVPPPSPLNVWRLLFWFAISLPATREYYAYVSDGRVKRMGPNLWLALACAVAEVALVVKGALHTAFPPGAHMPRHVVWLWGAAAAAFAVWCALKFSGVLAASRWRAVALNCVLLAAVAPLVALAVVEDVGYGLAAPPGAPVSHRPSAGPFDS